MKRDGKSQQETPQNKLPDGVRTNIALRQQIQEAVSGVVPNQQQSSKITEKVISVFAASESFRGPMPHPKHLAEYEAVCPGLADRIMKLAENALDKNENRKDKIIELEYRDRRRGMNYGFAALVLILLTGAVCIYFDHEYIGGTLLASSVIGAAVSAFINGRPSFPFSKKKDAEPVRPPPKPKSPRKSGPRRR